MCSPIPFQVTAVLCQVGTSARVVIIIHGNPVLHAVHPYQEAPVGNEVSFSSEWPKALNEAGEGESLEILNAGQHLKPVL